ncbi:integrase [Rhodobium orientis]|uniref:Integrase n=2 Tax=Rhodobium orientis TaxID=34017 RepID=A0A327JLR6_9HYPH|nr:integrase [Rhodobium orientis]
MQLYRPDGGRKYLNAEERQRFLDAAHSMDGRTRSLCQTLLYTGCRISEALALTPASIQASIGVVSIRSLKKRDRFVVREVPVPTSLIAELEDTHHIALIQQDRSLATTTRLWPWSRTTAWGRVKHAMSEAGIAGPHASPKGLRHSFGVHAVQSGVPLNLVQRWLGHANMTTTAIYADVVGNEEIAIAERMWSKN